MPNVMAALPNIGGALCSTPQSLSDPAAGVPCSNAASIEERKTWTQSDFFAKFRVGEQEPPKMYIWCTAQETAKHRAKFGCPPVSDVTAVTKPRRETR